MQLYIDTNAINLMEDLELQKIENQLQRRQKFYFNYTELKIQKILYYINSREGNIIIFRTSEKRVLKIIECTKIRKRFSSCPSSIRKQELKWWINNNIDIYFKLKYLKFLHIPAIYKIFYLNKIFNESGKISICICHQYCGEYTLSNYLKNNKITLINIKKILIQVISTIFFLDSYNIYHNDVNLGNIIIRPNLNKNNNKYIFKYLNKKYEFSGVMENKIFLIDYTMATYQYPRNQFKYLCHNLKENMYTYDIITLLVHILGHSNLPKNIYQEFKEILEHNIYQIHPTKFDPIYIKNRNLTKLLDFIFLIT